MKRKQNHLLPYGFFMTEVFEKFGVPIPAFESYLHYDAIDYYEIGGDHELLCTEVKNLHAQIERNEEAAARHIALVALITGFYQPVVPFITPTTQSFLDPSSFPFFC
ncbi:hypothetical protein HAX54_045282 [Datura stramonium]|uniref:Uncharacterized protein n=1 Tax=Datura stramonium TaxID=4076 RepID=A0ABS8RJL7_DATST|nr:hypothetical protein [Datura stramonium]